MFGSFPFTTSPFTTIGGDSIFETTWIDQCPGRSIFRDVDSSSNSWDDQGTPNSDWDNIIPEDIPSKRC